MRICIRTPLRLRTFTKYFGAGNAKGTNIVTRRKAAGTPRGVHQCQTADSITMKRKLDINDVPSTETPTQKGPTSGTFEDLRLDPRLLQAIFKEKYLKPTPIQASAIPLALQGRDILGL